ncbi:MAG: deoxyribonuclease IV, partial [Acidobacteriota bacterium]|nr:deoxyribonuclease IV [Acidobacteriota bacterium]
MRVGVHTSIAGGVENAARHAHEIGCDTFQMFSANPRGWRTLDPSPADCAKFREVRTGYKLAPVVVHDNYLINLASADPLIQEKSIAAFRKEIERALALGADFLVTHPGSAKGTTPSQAIDNCIGSIRKAADGLRIAGLKILIENTAGQGAVIGRTFEEVAEIIDGAARDVPMGACIDTAHCFAAGYPIHKPEGLRRTVKELDGTVGL